MKIEIEARSESEARALQVGLSDPEARAVVIISGTLLQLPDRRARGRVLSWAYDYVTDPRNLDADGRLNVRET